MMRSRLERLNGSTRIMGVDLARGLAVIGMFAAHLLDTVPWDWSDPQTWTTIADGRPSILFATLAGVSIGLVSGGPRPQGGAALRTTRLRLAVRAAILWFLGVMLISTGVPIYVILPAYAILFLLALPFLPLGARALLPIAAAFGVITPFLFAVIDAEPWWDTPAGTDAAALFGWNYPFLVWIAFVLAGLGLARTDVRLLTTQLAMTAAGSLLAVLGYGAVAWVPVTGAGYWARIWTAEAHSSGLLEVIGSGGFAIAVLGLCLLLCRTPLSWVVLPLRAVGAMPLTAYTVQVLVWAGVAVAVLGDAGDLSGIRELGFFWPLTVGTVIGCTAWALLVGRGPLEWATDAAARGLVPGTADRVDRVGS